MNTRVIPAIGLNLARRCKPVLLAQLYYAERELLLCCGVLSAFLGFFGAGGAFESLPLELFVDTFEVSKVRCKFGSSRYAVSSKSSGFKFDPHPFFLQPSHGEPETENARAACLSV